MANHNPPTNGLDKRKEQINRKGRPKSFDALRQLAQQIAHEEARKPGVNGQPGEPIVIDGHVATVTEMILRQWATSKDPRLVQAFIAYAYGKPPDDVNLKVDKPIVLKVVYDDK
jgi:hypothetical protein